MNNPPAFPPNAGWRDNDKNCQGMTLRDYFAAAALQGWLIKYGAMTKEDEAAFACFRYADAMLKAREQ